MAACCSGASRLSPLAKAALLAISFIGFANVLTYSGPDSYLGPYLEGLGATTGEALVAYGVDGAAVIASVLAVLLAQSLPAVAALRVAHKWSVVVAGQALAALSSALSVALPTFVGITVSRAAHGVAEALYMVYCLILLVECTPRAHMALGIASLTAGMTAGDSVGPVLGAMLYDAAGVRAAYLLQLAVNAAALLGAVLVVPLWVWSPAGDRQQLLDANREALPLHGAEAGSAQPEPQKSGNLCGSTDDVRHGQHCQGGRRSAAALPPCSSAGRLAVRPCGLAAQASPRTRTATVAAAVAVATTAPDASASEKQQSLAPGEPSAECSTAAPARYRSNSERLQQQSCCEQKSARIEAATGTAGSERSQRAPLASSNAHPTTLHNARAQKSSTATALSTAARDSRAAADQGMPTPGGGGTSTQPADRAAAATAAAAQGSKSEPGNQAPAPPSSAALATPLAEEGPMSRLELRSVLRLLADRAIAAQCLLLLLEQLVRSCLTVVLPVSMGTRQLVVGAVYMANVVGSVMSPFLVDAWMSRCRGAPTHLLSAWTSAVLAVTCAAVVPLSRVLPALVAVLLLAGAVQAAIETLVYVHVAQRLDALHERNAAVSMCAYIVAQTTGGGLGSLLGSYLQRSDATTQAIVCAAAAGAAGLYGAVLGARAHRRVRRSPAGAAGASGSACRAPVVVSR